MIADPTLHRTLYSVPDPAFTIEVDRMSPDEWGHSTAQFADACLYQTWPYGNVRWGRRSLSHLVLKRGSEIVAMAQLRITPAWRVRCGIAYLQWGPLFQRHGAEPDETALRAIANALQDEYVGKRGLFLRILPAAIEGSSKAQLLESAFSDCRRDPFRPGQTYRTLILNLAPSLDELRKKLDGKWRNQLNRAEKNNLVMEAGQSEKLFLSFVRVYEEMMSRKKFETSTDVHEFARMQRELPEAQRMQVFVCSENGVPVSGVIATAMGHTGVYLFGATSDAGLKSKGAYLLQWSVVKWLKDRGVHYYNLGGINPETNPGVFHFKNGLGGDDVRYAPAFVSCKSFASKVLVTLGSMLRTGLRRPRRARQPA